MVIDSLVPILVVHGGSPETNLLVLYRGLIHTRSLSWCLSGVVEVLAIRRRMYNRPEELLTTRFLMRHSHMLRIHV